MSDEDTTNPGTDLSLEPRSGHNQQLTSLPNPQIVTGPNRPLRPTESSNHSSRNCRRSNSRRSRSRHRHSSRRHSRYNPRTYFRQKERNFAAATGSMVTIVLLCSALLPDWIYLKGGSCHLLYNAKGSLHHLSTTQFFYSGQFYESLPLTLTKEGDSLYQFSSSPTDVMVNCVTNGSVLLFKASIAFTLIAIFLSFVAFLLDLTGPDYHIFKILRRNAIFNILSVVLCVTVNLFAYWITTAVERLQFNTMPNPGNKVEVTFDASFYLITAAGGISVIATACNCLRRHSHHSSGDLHRPSDYFDDSEALLGPPSSPHGMFPGPNHPPPPAYTP